MWHGWDLHSASGMLLQKQSDTKSKNWVKHMNRHVSDVAGTHKQEQTNASCTTAKELRLLSADAQPGML